MSFLFFQDTVVALQAVAAFAEYSFAAGINQNITILTSSLKDSVDFYIETSITDSERFLQHRELLPAIPNELIVISQGQGCALVQVHRNSCFSAI